MGVLVADTYALHARGKLDGVGLAEEPGVEIPNSTRNLGRIQPDVEHWNAGDTLLLDWVVDVDHDEVEVDAMSLQDMAEKLGDLLLDSILPITLREIAGKTLHTQDGDPVLVSTVQH